MWVWDKKQCGRNGLRCQEVHETAINTIWHCKKIVCQEQNSGDRINLLLRTLFRRSGKLLIGLAAPVPVPVIVAIAIAIAYAFSSFVSIFRVILGQLCTTESSPTELAAATAKCNSFILAYFEGIASFDILYMFFS